jgi:hypothetical protein
MIALAPRTVQNMREGNPAVTGTFQPELVYPSRLCDSTSACFSVIVVEDDGDGHLLRSGRDLGPHT